jgi:hypothetical protein
VSNSKQFVTVFVFRCGNEKPDESACPELCAGIHIDTKQFVDEADLKRDFGDTRIPFHCMECNSTGQSKASAALSLKQIELFL